MFVISDTQELFPLVDKDFSRRKSYRRYQSQKLNVNSLDLGENGYLVSDFILSQGENPSLQKVNLRGCIMPLTNLVNFIQFLSRCKHITYLNLSENRLGEAGHFLTESINHWGSEPQLKKLFLYDCSIPYGVSREFLQSLSLCNNLTHLNLGKNFLDLAGSDLAHSITLWGKSPPLRKLGLLDCSIKDNASIELAQSLSTCKYLTHLDLSGNSLRKATTDLAQSIEFWGDEPPLQQLILENCSMLGHSASELVKSLFTCRHLIVLNLGENQLGAAGYNLAHSIRSWGKVPPLKELYLHSCSMPENASKEVVQSLSNCKSLTHLELGRNILGEAGQYLAESIKSWGDDPPIQELMLEDCGMSGNASAKLLETLSICRYLTGISLSGNNLGEAGHHLAQSVMSWGENAPLQRFFLANCSMPVDIWNELFKSLSVCKNLVELDAPEEVLDRTEYIIPMFLRSLLKYQKHQYVKVEVTEVSLLTYKL